VPSEVGLQAAGDDTVWANASKQGHELTAPPSAGQRWGSAARAAAPSQVNLKAAGVDVGAESHYVVTVPEGGDPEGCDVREFRAFTEDLYALARWPTGSPAAARPARPWRWSPREPSRV